MLMPASLVLGTALAAADGRGQLTAFEPSCASYVVTAEDAERCWTPRTGVLSGGYVAMDIGFANLRPSVSDRIGAGTALALRVRIGFEFWDHVVLGIGGGSLFFSDKHPTYERVVDCTVDENFNQMCDSTPHSESSSITGTIGVIEGAYQHRLRPARAVSLVPALYMGYQFSTQLKRGVDCESCPYTLLDASAEGAYVAPFFRATFMSIASLFVRSDWYFTGDLVHQSSVGFELGLP